MLSRYVRGDPDMLTNLFHECRPWPQLVDEWCGYSASFTNTLDFHMVELPARSPSSCCLFLPTISHP